MRSSKRRGAAMVYSLFAFFGMAMFVSLGSDWARVQLIKTEMHRAAFAAARAGAAALPGGSAAARTAVRDQVALNKVDGGVINVLNADIIIGRWNSVTKTLDTNAANPNAVRVQLHRLQSRNTGVETYFAGIFGHKYVDANAQSTALFVSPIDTNYDIPATANPWLAGMPGGTVANRVNPHNNPDYASGTPNKPSASPVPVLVPLVPGQELNFGSISGYSNNDVNYDPNVNYSPDGNFDWIVHNRYATNATGGIENGIGDVTAPINSIIGVFLDDSQPDSTSAPTETLNFSDTTQRDFATSRPKLKQPFFIGDGLRNDGRTLQHFIIPAGATRFYIAQMDEYEWNNNRGVRTFKVTTPGRVQSVE